MQHGILQADSELTTLPQPQVMSRWQQLINNKRHTSWAIKIFVVLMIVFIYFQVPLVKGVVSLIQRDFQTAYADLTKSSEQGFAISNYLLGMMYTHGKGVPKDHTKAFQEYLTAAQAGYHFAQNQVGEMYYYGLGVEQDDAKAFEWFYKAATQDNTKAQLNLGIMYFDGDAVAIDRQESFVWLSKACENGSFISCKLYRHAVIRDLEEFIQTTNQLSALEQ